MSPATVSQFWARCKPKHSTRPLDAKPLSLQVYPALSISFEQHKADSNTWVQMAQGAPGAQSKATGVSPRLYLSQREHNITAAILPAGKADVAVRGEHPPRRVAAAEGCPEGTVYHSVQPLLPRQPEESPEELILCSSLQVPGERMRRVNVSSQTRPRHPLASLIVRACRQLLCPQSLRRPQCSTFTANPASRTH